MKVLVIQRSQQTARIAGPVFAKTKKTATLLCIFLFMVFHAVAQNQILVKGRITNETKQPVAGVTVAVKGTTNGVSSNDNGEYQINVASNATLVISAVGYPPVEVKVNGQATHDVSLTTRASDLDQVIVIGYGTQRKGDVTGSTVSVKGETLNEIKAPNIYNQLQGRAAGVDIVSNSSQIGSGGQIRIRGNRSITGNNNPLIVVDGMAYGGSINDINPENIASLDVLKDASATAIYGSRGANGVIIITTKRGSTGKPVTTYNGYVGMVEPIGTYRLFNGQEYAQFKEDARIGNSKPAGANPPSTNTNSYALTNTEKANLANGVSTDWQDLLLTTGIRTSHDVNVRGGNDRTQYFFGGGYYRETGIITDQSLNRYSFNVNLDHKLSERIKVGFTSFNTLIRSNRLGTNAYGSATRLSPLFKPYNDDGTINFKPASEQGVDAQQINPLTSIGNNDLIRAFQRRYQFQHNFYGELGIIKGLKFRTTFGYGWSQTLDDNYTGPNTVFNSNSTAAGATLSQNNAEGWQYTVNNSLEYRTEIGKHKLQAQVLQEIQKNHFQAQQFNGVGVPADFIQDYNWLLVNTITPQAGNFSESALIGYMGRIIYSFDDKYLLTATVRRDGASVLAPGNQWVTYPAVSVGWNLDREEFLKDASFISSLKLRAGWGISSNAGINPYTTLGSLGTSFYNFGSSFSNGYTINTSPNPDLTWEKTKGFNLGIDFSFFHNRLSGAIEYYDNKTSDILLQKNLPRSNGTNSILTNAGKTATRGMEFTLSSVNVRSNSGLTWRTDFNLSFTREKIVALQNNLQADVNNGWFVGHPVTTIYDVKKIGIWQTSEAAEAAKFGVFPGDIKLADLDGPNHDGKPDGKIDANDRTIVGNFQPDFVAGLSNRFEYKNFDLNVVMFGRFGQTVVATYLSADGGAAGYPFFMNSRVNQLKVDYWTPTNATNAFPQPDAGVDGLQYTSTLTYRDGSFIKIRTIDLGYTFSERLLKKTGLQSLRVYVSAQNPFILWSPLVRDNLGIDPEGNGTGNAVGSNAGGGAPVQARAITVGMGVPPARLFIFGVNLKF
jgi:TonB-linked SusC/RagA family outer membrane protein